MLLCVALSQCPACMRLSSGTTPFAQAKISAARLRARIGKTIRVLVDAHEGSIAIGRSTADAPEIDGTVRIVNGGTLGIGSFAQVTVTSSDEHDLTAHVTK